MACTILHIILLDYDGIDDWGNRMNKAKFDGNDDTVYLNSVSIHQSHLMDNIMYITLVFADDSVADPAIVPTVLATSTLDAINVSTLTLLAA
jgi:hypothetical protein